jgi:hypothetical protein
LASPPHGEGDAVLAAQEDLVRRHRRNRDQQPGGGGQKRLPDAVGEGRHVDRPLRRGQAGKGLDHPQDGAEESEQRRHPPRHRQGSPAAVEPAHRFLHRDRGGAFAAFRESAETQGLDQGQQGRSLRRRDLARRRRVAVAGGGDQGAFGLGVGQAEGGKGDAAFEQDRQRRHRQRQQRPHQDAALFHPGHGLVSLSRGCHRRRNAAASRSRPMISRKGGPGFGFAAGS